MNDFEFIDYNKPINSLRDDFRTSSYRGHVFMSDTNLRKNLNAKIGDIKSYNDDPELLRRRISDYKTNFTIKPGNPGELRNPKLSMKQQFIKPYDECRLRFIKRPMRPATSSSHDDFQWRQPIRQENRTFSMHMPEATKQTSIYINRAAPSYVKYLDPSATTMRLDYCYRSPTELERSVARKDNITFWNWKDKQHNLRKLEPIPDEHMCQELPADQCPKRRNEYPSQLKRVPNTGMTTEFRQNFLEPRSRDVPELNAQFIRNALVNVQEVPNAKATESKLIGSGEKTQKYV